MTRGGAAEGALPAQPLGSSCSRRSGCRSESRRTRRVARRVRSPRWRRREPGPEAGRRAESPGFLIANQVNQYVDQVQEFGHVLKLYLVSGAQGVDTVAPVTPAAEA